MLCAVSVVIARTDPVATGRGVHLTVSVATIAALLGVGLYAWYREGESRFGQVLFVTGDLLVLRQPSPTPTLACLYSVGRIAGWAFEVVLAYALLSYPTGGSRAAGRGWWWSAARC